MSRSVYLFLCVITYIPIMVGLGWALKWMALNWGVWSILFGFIPAMLLIAVIIDLRQNKRNGQP